MKAETLSLSQTAVSTRVFSGLRTAGVCLLVLLISASFDSTSSRETRDAYRRVKANLLSHPYAVDKIPPNVVSRENINILIGFDPEQILFVNEVDMTVTIAATISFGWSDRSNESVEMVSVPTHDVWTPTIVNSLSIDSNEMVIELPPLLKIHHTGNLRTVQMLTMTVSCTFDMEWFPLDEQRCAFPFMPFNVDTSSVSTVPVSGQRSSRAQEDESTVDWTWEEVTPRETLSQVETTSDKYRNFSYVSFEVLMRRRGRTFYLTNVIFPVAASGLLTHLVFLIPPAAGEKISFVVSIFISTSVFLSSLSNTMPKGQGGICRFNVFVVSITVQNILATAASIFVLHRYMKEQEENQEEVTSPTSPTTERDNFPDSPNSPLQQLGHRRIVPLTDTCTDTGNPKKSIPSSWADTFSQPKSDECEPAVSLAVPHKQTRPAKLGVDGGTGIRRCWARGDRLSSTQLDRIFFAIFTVLSTAIVLFITLVP